jgi:hypothetical protein
MLQMPEHKKYKWIQVDEVQDLNALQLAIVDELTDSDPTVMYLGDEQQAIFSFMGADNVAVLVPPRRTWGTAFLTLRVPLISHQWYRYA